VNIPRELFQEAADGLPGSDPMMRVSVSAKPFFQSFYRNNHLCWGATLVLDLLQVPFHLWIAWILGAILDAAGAGDLARLEELFRGTVAMVALYGLWLLALERVRARWVHRALEQYKSLAFRRLTEKSVSAFSKESTGRYLSALTNDAATLEEKYLVTRSTLACQAALFLGALGMMWVYSPALTVVAGVLSLLPLVAALAAGGALARREKAVSDQNQAFVGRLQDLLNGFAVLKSFKAEGEALTRFDQANRRTEEIKQDRRWWAGVLSAAGDVCGTVMQFGVFFFGSWLAIRGEITAGTVLVFVQMCNYLIQPVAKIPKLWAERQGAMGLVEKLAQAVEENAGRTGEPIPPELHDAIRLQDVAFGYGGGEPVLKGVSLTLEAGKKYALVGPSGSGKSTLLNLLMGAQDGYEGSITVDGRELRTIHPDSLYDLESLIGQSVYLFDDTLRRNITLFRDFPEEAVASAVERAGLGELMAAKGEGYGCGENGANLSGGERQRVSIARCLLRNTPVLLLDEATAALDNQTAFEVVDALLKLEGLTRLVVTHRLEKELLEQYDGIFVLKNGVVGEAGTFQELMERRGTFYSLYTLST